MKNITIRFIFIFIAVVVHAQHIDILIKNGHIFDPKNNIDSVMDIAVSDGKILEVAPNISSDSADKVIDATGLYVCPGLIDIHTHVFVGSTLRKFADGTYSLSPDDFTFKAGVTTVVDAGCSGWRNFPLFKKQVIDESQTRILAWLNIAASGMTGSPTEENVDEMDVEKTVEAIREYADYIVGVKIGHYRGELWTPWERASEAAQKTDRPLFVECHLPHYTLKEQLEHMHPGDIITHSFENVRERTPIVGEDGKVLPYVWEAKERGILFDVGHGGAGFWFNQAIPALEQNFWPNSFGTDLHRFSMNAGMKDFLNLMSKYLNMGMPLKEILLRGSWYPAKSIKREDLGNLSVGTVADIAVLSVRTGKFGFIDARNNRIDGDRKFEAELTIRAGKVVWDLNGLAANAFVR